MGVCSDAGGDVECGAWLPTYRVARMADSTTLHPHSSAIATAQGTVVSVAPMMDCTDRFDRYFLRLMSRRTLLFTEMLTANAVIHGDRSKLLAHHLDEHPVALQLGGADPKLMAESAAIGEDFGYDEINMNVGCPSDRVQAGRFGACLMAEPSTVAECVNAMSVATGVPVTVKCRIGVDEHDSFEALVAFVEQVVAAGCKHLYVHARKAWLKGLSPKENREIPPLKYDVVARLKPLFPSLPISLNGGIETLDEAEQHLRTFDGVMIGRAAYRNPYLLAEVDQRLYGDSWSPGSREEVVERMLPFIEEQLREGVRLGTISRHMVGLFLGQPGAKSWRRHISENAHRPGAGTDVLIEALQKVAAATPAVAA